MTVASRRGEGSISDVSSSSLADLDLVSRMGSQANGQGGYLGGLVLIQVGAVIAPDC